MQGIANLTDAESAALIGRDRESHQRDLYESIAKGDFPRWRLMVQVMPERDAEKTPYNPFDLTKVWPHGDYPLIEGRGHGAEPQPENYFAEVEQSAFSPAMSCRASATARTRCSSSASSPTPTRTATAWALIMRACP